MTKLCTLSLRESPNALLTKLILATMIFFFQSLQSPNQMAQLKMLNYWKDSDGQLIFAQINPAIDETYKCSLEERRN